MFSDHGSNFVGARKDIKDFYDFLKDQEVQERVSQFCSLQHIEWNFIPEKEPNFRGLWESAEKSMKYHLKRITAKRILHSSTEVEACLNSRPLVSIPCDSDGVEMLTPAHFLIGRPTTGSTA